MQTGINETEMTINPTILDEAPSEELVDVDTRSPQDYPPDEEPKYGQLNKEISESFNVMHGEGDEDESFEDMNSIARHEDLLHHTCDNLLIDCQPTELQDALGTASSVDDVPGNIIASGAATVAKAVNSFKPNAYADVQTYLGKDIESCNLEDIEKGEKLIEQLNLIEAFTHLSVTGCMTQIRIMLGRILIRLKELVKKFTDENWEEFAANAFPFLPKSTRAAYMKIASIQGAHLYPQLGIELLRKVAKVVKDDEIQGEDQIKALLEKHGVECDLNISHKEFKARLLGIIDPPSDDDDDLETSGGDNEDSAGDDDLETSDDVDDGSADNDDDAADDDVVDDGAVDDDSVDTEDEQDDAVDDDSIDTEDEEDDIKETASSNTAGVNDSPEEETKEEKELKKLLNQDSVNKQCAKIMKTSQGIIEKQLPKDKFETLVIDKAIQALVNLKEYIKN